MTHPRAMKRSSAWGTLRRITLRKARHAAQRRPNQDTADESESLLLNLPPELLLHIADFLPIPGRIVLAMTCSSIRQLLMSRVALKCSMASATSKQYADYLFAIASATSNQWPCDYCLKLHEVNYKNTPTNRKLPSKMKCDEEVDISRVSPPDWPLYRHAHLAFKYNRLKDIVGSKSEKQHSKHLKDLLAPSKYVHRHEASGYEETYEVHHMVVQGRYLLRFTHRQPETGSIDYFEECLHSSSWRWDYRDLPSTADDGDIEVRRAEARSLQINEPDDDEQETLHNGEVTRSCGFCPTDLAVRIRGREVTATAWYDLGAECPPSQWILEPGGYYQNAMFREIFPVRVRHEDQNIRRMWEDEEDRIIAEQFGVQK